MILPALRCSSIHYLSEGESLYTGGKVAVRDTGISRKDRKHLEKELKGLLRPNPNTTLLGIRLKLIVYTLAGKPKKERGFRHWLRTKVGEPPVLSSQVDLEYNADMLRNYSENRGYFQAWTESKFTHRRRNASAFYTVRPGKRYILREVFFPSDSSLISKAISSTVHGTVLKPGHAYNLVDIKSERERIDARLKETGFYYFGPKYLIIQVDSTVGDCQVDVRVKVKNDTPKKAKEIYTVNNIIVYSNYSITTDTTAYSPEDVVKHNDFTIIDPAKTINPRIFDRALLFKKGDMYNREEHKLSLNRLVDLGAFKFVKIEFKASDTLKNALDVYYFLTLLPKKSLGAEVLAKTNSANYTGTELTVNWSNKNAFKGAELLTLSAFGGLEFQVSGQNEGFNVYRVGSEAGLIWPKLIAPFRVITSGGFMTRTRATIGYEFQNRVKLYSLNSFKGYVGYVWKQNINQEHRFNITDIHLVTPVNVTDLYRTQIIANPSLGKVIEKQLIFGPTYSYTFTNTMRKRKKNTIYYRAGLEAAGTIAGLVSGADVKKGDTTEIFKIPFSQFVKSEHDFRHYFRLGNNAQLASRIIVGAGFAYGNSSELPFIKQFFIGGTNSIRAFRTRSIGPGTYKPETGNSPFLPDQSGDLKLECNTEYRMKIYGIVHGAVFIGAGNIWLLHKKPEQPGAEISSSFPDEIAVGTGVGLRFDFSFLVLRTDLAFPVRKPYLPQGRRWVFDEINFGSSPWRKANLVFNLAIGYPF